ncbi:hypothetical protein [Myxococcus sp. Y35]|uniref:hypothetical protein n=1 Tax=Pseudomyxococcus flavus TaxID=3115648 RepID=UPI003CF2405E
MDRCFVIQPFDRGKFDKRYGDTYEPAIKAAGLTPYRVDCDPQVTIPIDEIEKNIRESRVCLADITTDNPNVWYEVGFAIASRKDVVLLCSTEREGKFPFDIQHRSILKYGIDSASDWIKLKNSIAERLHAILSRQAKTELIADMSPVRPTEGLTPHEMAALVVIAESCMMLDDHITGWRFRQGMNNAGFTDLAASVSLRCLERKKFISCKREHDENGAPFTMISLTNNGESWLIEHQSRFDMKLAHTKKLRLEDDDIPF